MGEVQVNSRLENLLDGELLAMGMIKPDSLRSPSVMAYLDTGTRTLELRKEIAHSWGLRDIGLALVSYRDGPKEERLIRGYVTVITKLYTGKRRAFTTGVVGQPQTPVLLGQVPIELLDVLVDCGAQRLIPRPESPFIPMMPVYL